MQIGFDAKRYFNNKSGLGNYSRGVVNNLAATYPQHTFQLFTKNLFDDNLPQGNMHQVCPQNKSLLWRQFGIAKRCKEIGIDVFHGLSNEIPFGFLKQGIKSVVTIHDVIFKKFPMHYKWADRMLYDFKTKYALKNANKIIAISEAVKADLIKYYKADKTKIEVVYQFLEPEFYAPIENSSLIHSFPYFVYISSFQQRKNHLALLDAYAKIHKQVDQALVLVGMMGEMYEEALSFVEKNGLQNKVYFHLNVPVSDKINLIKNASGFVYPSLDEGFGIPLAEAAVLNVPLAVSNIPIFREIAGKAALYFHPNNANEIASTLLQLALPETKKLFYDNKVIITNKVDRTILASKFMKVYES